MEFTETIGPKKETDISLWTVAIPEIRPFLMGKKRKAQDKALRFIQKLEGFVGFHPVIGRGTLCLFRTENEAKRARNLIQDAGCPTGYNITECWAPRDSIPEAVLAEIEKDRGSGTGR